MGEVDRRNRMPHAAPMQRVRSKTGRANNNDHVSDIVSDETQAAILPERLGVSPVSLQALPESPTGSIISLLGNNCAPSNVPLHSDSSSRGPVRHWVVLDVPQAAQRRGMARPCSSRRTARETKRPLEPRGRLPADPRPPADELDGVAGALAGAVGGVDTCHVGSDRQRLDPVSTSERLLAIPVRFMALLQRRATCVCFYAAKQKTRGRGGGGRRALAGGGLGNGATRGARHLPTTRNHRPDIPRPSVARSSKGRVCASRDSWDCIPDAAASVGGREHPPISTWCCCMRPTRCLGSRERERLPLKASRLLLFATSGHPWCCWWSLSVRHRHASAQQGMRKRRCQRLAYLGRKAKPGVGYPRDA